MKIYTDYGFYECVYKGSMSEDDFERLVIKASCEVNKNIFSRNTEKYDLEVQLATCSITDILYKIEQLENKLNNSISNEMLKSESVGDYSRTFNSAGIDDIKNEISNQKSNIKEELRRYLLNTGLLYRGV